jgi:hypothetical protein
MEQLASEKVQLQGLGGERLLQLEQLQARHPHD